MDIEITSLFVSDTWLMSGSIATHGADAGPSTWANALEEAQERPILSTKDELDACRRHIHAMGFGGEVMTYPAAEVNALFLQLVSGDKREAGMDDCDIEDFDWDDYDARASEGQISGNIFKGDDGKIYYSLSD